MWATRKERAMNSLEPHLDIEALARRRVGIRLGLYVHALVFVR